MSQLTQYSSSDASAPQLTGQAGSLITVLDAILINGYGSKAAAGWSKPVATASNISTYKQGAASVAKATLLVNDNGPTAQTYQEASFCGYATCTSVAATMGAGTGQFPLPAQLLTTGRVNIRKSSSLDSSPRPWVAFADDRTVYFFSRSGDSVLNGVYYATSLCFGEIYSYYPGTTDVGNCLVCGLGSDNNGSPSAAAGGVDCLVTYNTALATWGCYMLNSPGATGSSTRVTLQGAGDKSAVGNQSFGGPQIGVCPCPNPADGSLNIVPARVVDNVGSERGRLRGLYYWMHPLASITDGAIYQGSNDLAGRTFVAVAPCWAGGCVLIEISNTVDTNA